MDEFYFALIAFFVAFFVGRLLIPSIIFVSMKRRLFDNPDVRKLHVRRISRLGGVAFLPAAFMGFCISVFVMSWLQPELTSLLLQDYLQYMCLFVVGAIIIFITGITDDLSGLTYRVKFLFQGVAAMMIVAPLLYVKSLGGILGIWDLPALVSILPTVIVVILIINSYNLIDGVDGLCSGLSIVTLTTLFIAFISLTGTLAFIFLAGMIGVLAIFFFYNVFGRRLKVFMGDSGSLVLGFTIAYVILRYLDTPDGGALNQNSFALVIGCVFVPVFDATRLFLFRMIKGNSPFMPDKNHIHHKFIAIGLTHIQTTFSIICMQIGYILFNVILTRYLDINIIILLDISLGVGVNALLNALIKRRVLVRKLTPQGAPTPRKELIL